MQIGGGFCFTFFKDRKMWWVMMKLALLRMCDLTVHCAGIVSINLWVEDTDG